MKKFLIAIFILIGSIYIPAQGMNKKIGKYLDTIASKVKNAYSKTPYNKKQLYQKVALGATTGLGILKINSLSTHMNESSDINQDNEHNKLFLEIIAHELRAIPSELLQKLEENPELLRKVIIFFYIHQENTLIDNNTVAINTWETIFSQFNLKELYDMKDLANFIVHEINKKNNVEVLMYIDTEESDREKRLIDIKKENKLKEKTTDELSIECRNIALQHGVTIPEWIQFRISPLPGFFSNKEKSTILVSKNEDGTFGFTLTALFGPSTNKILRLADDEFAGMLGHELGHLTLKHKYFRNQKDEEIAADRYMCFESNKACLGAIKAFSRIIGFYRTQLKNNGLTQNEINTKVKQFGKLSNTYPPLQKRIHKMQKIMNDIKQEKNGLCKNPFYKQLGSNKWFECKKYNNPTENELHITKNY